MGRSWRRSLIFVKIVLLYLIDLFDAFDIDAYQCNVQIAYSLCDCLIFGFDFYFGGSESFSSCTYNQVAWFAACLENQKLFPFPDFF